MESLASFLPKSVIDLLYHKKSFAIYEGTVLFADVAGFTPLTESLMVLGKEGSEELTNILNEHFSRMIEIAENFGGDVLRFAGDAMTIFFPYDSGKNAVCCSLKMLEKMKQHSLVRSRAGEFELAMKIGVARGNIQIGIVSDKGKIDYYAIGEPLDASAEAEHNSNKGELVASTNIVVPDTLQKIQIAENFFKISGILKKEEKVELKIPNVDNLETILPNHIIEYSSHSSYGEHRGTSVIFLSFNLEKKNPEEIHSSIEEIYKSIIKSTKKFGGLLNKLDFGDKGAKAIILFGTPYSIENKEEMAIRATIEIKTLMEKKFGLKGGITTSFLFSCVVGSKSRKEFTVMGDGINLAARLMQYSKEGEFICDENTFLKSSNSIDFADKGKISVKGKIKAVQIYSPIKVREVFEPKKQNKLYGFSEIQERLKSFLFEKDRKAILLTAQAGGGKTSLFEWFVEEAMLREYKIFPIRLFPFSKDVFFSLFVKFFKTTFDIRNREDLKTLYPLLPPNLANFYEVITPYFGFEEIKKEELKNLTPKEKRDIAYLILCNLILKKEKFIIAVDNLSYIDEPSYDFISYCFNQFEGKLFDLVGFSREEILSSKIYNIFEENIKIPSLTKENIKEILQEKNLISDISEKSLNFFYEKSKGNPQLLFAITNVVEQEGLIKTSQGVKYIDEDRLFNSPFPDSLEAIYLKDFDRLNPDEKTLLFETSILGSSASLNILRQISTFSGDKFENTLKSVIKKGFLRYDDAEKGRYLLFSDNLLHQAIYEIVPFKLKREYHKKIFESLTQIEGMAKSSIFPFLAYHAERADLEEEAVNFHRLSGRIAIQRLDNSGALSHLEYVIKNGSVGKDYFLDAFDLMNIYLELGKFDEMKNLFKQLESLKDKMSKEDEATFFNFASEIDIREGKIDKAERHLKKSLKIATKAGYVLGVARALLNLVGRVYGPSGRYEEGIKSIEKLLSLPHYEGEAVFKVVSLMNMGLIMRHLQKHQESYSYYKKALNLSRKFKLPLKQPIILSNLIVLNYQISKFKKSILYSQKGLTLADNFSQRELYLLISNFYALSLWAIGETSKALSISLQASQRARFFNKVYSEALAYTVLAVSQFEELHFLDSFKNLRKSIELFESISCPAECYSSKLEYLRLLEFIDDRETLEKFIRDWGGREKILLESRKFSLLESLISVLYPLKTLNELINRKEFDSDIAFIYFLRTNDKEFLKSFTLPKSLRYDLKVKFIWAYLKCKLKPPYPPLKLLSKSKGGIYGLKILSILYRSNIEKRRFSIATKIRKKFLENLYFAKINSDETIWECIIKDEDIKFAIKGHSKVKILRRV